MKPHVLVIVAFYALSACSGDNKAYSKPEKDDTPSNDLVLNTVRGFASETLGYKGSFGDQKPIFDVISVEVVATSSTENQCEVIANAAANWTQHFKDCDRVISLKGMANWIPHNQLDFRIDQQWLAKQKTMKSYTFKEIKMHFKRYDSGWRFERADLGY